jgi:hypothetical protein
LNLPLKGFPLVYHFDFRYFILGLIQFIDRFDPFELLLVSSPMPEIRKMRIASGFFPGEMGQETGQGAFLHKQAVIAKVLPSRSPLDGVFIPAIFPNTFDARWYSRIKTLPFADRTRKVSFRTALPRRGGFS